MPAYFRAGPWRRKDEYSASSWIDPEDVQAVAVSAIPSSDSPLTERGKEQELWLTAEETWWSAGSAAWTYEAPLSTRSSQVLIIEMADKQNGWNAARRGNAVPA